MKNMKKSFIIIFACVVSGAMLLTSCANRRAAPSVPDSGLEPGFTLAALPGAPVAVSANTRIMPLKPVILAISSGKMSDINLTIPAKFIIAKPSDSLTTTLEKYFITGLSDPQKPVYFGDAEIERMGTKGVFGVLVDLQMGENTFTFSQDGKNQTVKITRKAYVPSASIPIGDINQSSMVPSIFAGAKVGGELELGCIAPSGASVTAKFGGKSVKLKQAAVTELEGVPAFFKGSIPIEAGDGYDSDITQIAGKVAYEMTYKNETKKYESSGDVYIAGENSRIAVRVKDYMAFVYPKSDLNDLPQESEKLKFGAADYMKSQGNLYAELSSGGFVAKERVEIIEGKVTVGNKLSKVKNSKKSKNETYTFTGTNKPAYATNLSNGKFSITFFNTTGAPEANVSGSKLFSDVAVKEGENSVTYTFTLGAGSLWGYNVGFNGKNTILAFNYKPELGSDPRPFEGMTIVIDPGHGGKEIGAAGIANLNGPAEADLNLAHAYATRDLLASMGANVLLTRADDTYFDLDSRLKTPEATKADMFISLHHNSIGENVDANKIFGVEVYYHTGMSKKLADSMMSRVTSGLNRKERFVEQSYYRVTLSPYSPSVLVELGYISNPLEYERATSESQINKVAEAVAAGIKQALS